MKVDTNLHQGKPPSLEEGPLGYGRINDDSISNRPKRSNKCSRCMQFMKVILYLELILFIGWLGCIFLTNYYWDPRYNNVDRSYDLQDWEHGQSIEDFSINSDPTPVNDAGQSIEADDSKRDNEQTETFADVKFEDKNYSIETEAPVTSSVIDIRDQDMEESMLLSKWLSMLKLPEKSDDRAESLGKSDAFWDRMMASVEDMNDKSIASSEEKMTLTDDSVTESALRHYIRTMETNDHDLSQIDVDDLTPLTFLLEFALGGDYTDEMTDAEKEVLQDDRFTNMKIDFELPDIMERHLLSRMARATDTTENSDSSSSSEETKSPTPKTNSSTESSSSEETKDPPPKTKRSTESSSSEETKSPAPKTKRSAESSSSESESTNDNETGDKSDSSDSSSDENDPITTEAAGKIQNCPKIVDENGQAIDDPKEIVKYIKRNWFNWLLETPVPDCDGPKSAKTITIDECGKFVIKCTPADSENEATDQIKEALTSHRDTRSIEKNDAELDPCERLFVRMVKTSMDLMMQIETGKTRLTIPLAYELEENFKKAFASLVVQLIVEQATNDANWTDQRWQDFMQETRRNIINSMDLEHQLQLKKINLLDQEFMNNLRHAAESTSNIYTNCYNYAMDNGVHISVAIEIKMMIERKKCSRMCNAMTERVSSLAKEIVPGVPSESTVRYMIAALMLLDSEKLLNNPIHITDDHWRNYMINIQREIATFPDDSTIWGRIEDLVPPTQNQVNKLREIMQYYVPKCKKCRSMTLDENRSEVQLSVFGVVGQPRDKRWVMADPILEKTVTVCRYDLVDTQFLAERQARLAAWEQVKEKGHGPIRHTLRALEPALSAANTSEIPLTDISPEHSGLLLLTNHLLTNSSSELRKEGYELLRDLILEVREMEDQVGEWEGYDTRKFVANLTECLYGSRENMTSEMIFTLVVNTGKAGNLRYSGLGDIEDCNKPLKPVYGEFIYVGNEPESSGIQQWRHMLNAIVNLYFKIENSKGRAGCNSSITETNTPGSSLIGESKDVVKRSIGYPTRKSENSVNMAEKAFSEIDDSGSLRRANLGNDGEQQSFDMSQEMFFDKMELLSSHIDRLHERYLRFNELNDDYVSREFPIESPLNNEY